MRAAGRSASSTAQGTPSTPRTRQVISTPGAALASARRTRPSSSCPPATPLMSTAPVSVRPLNRVQGTAARTASTWSCNGGGSAAWAGRVGGARSNAAGPPAGAGSVGVTLAAMSSAKTSGGAALGGRGLDASRSCAAWSWCAVSNHPGGRSSHQAVPAANIATAPTESHAAALVRARADGTGPVWRVARRLALPPGTVASTGLGLATRVPGTLASALPNSACNAFAELGGRLEALLRALRQRLDDDRLQPRRNGHGRGLRRTRRGRVDNMVHDRDGAALERPPAGEHPVQHDASRIEVGPLVDALASNLLGRHVGGRADDCPRLRQAAAVEMGDAEIGDLDPPAAGQDDVRRLDVAMDDAVLVAVLQPGEQPRHDHRHLIRRQRLPRQQPGTERGALDVLHDDVGELFGLAVVVDADDVGTVQPSGGLGLAAETAAERGVLRILVVQRQRLDRHPAGDGRVPRFVDGPHRAAADTGADLIFAEPLPFH